MFKCVVPCLWEYSSINQFLFTSNMPLKKRVKTLRSQCLMAIAEKIESWCEANKENMSEPSNAIEFFRHIPHTLVTDLLLTLIEQTFLDPIHLRLLLHEHTECLQLYHRQKDLNFLDEVAELISTRSQKLKHLDLRSCDCRTIEATSMVRLVQTISNIEILCLCSVNICDVVLSAIGYHCSKLQVLDVRGCSQVTDAGIAALCGDSKQGYRSSGCLNLQMLDVQRTSVTASGIQCALTNLPFLREFHYDYQYQAWTHYFEECRMGVSKIVNKFHLTILIVEIRDSATDYREFFEFLNEACPNVTQLELNFRKSVRYVQVECLENLHKLGVYGNEDFPIDDENAYHDDITNLLRPVGARLTELSLWCTSRINIDSIGQLCPLLQYLCINNSLDFISCNLTINQASVIQPFMHLKTLNIDGVIEFTSGFGSDITSKHFLKLMANSHKLQRLIFNNCNELTDHLIQAILKVNSLPSLEYLSLTRCHRITINSIMTLIALENSLSTVSIIRCSAILSEDFQIIENRIEQDNLELNFEYE